MSPGKDGSGHRAPRNAGDAQAHSPGGGSPGEASLVPGDGGDLLRSSDFQTHTSGSAVPCTVLAGWDHGV